MVRDSAVTQKIWSGTVIARFVISPSEMMLSTPPPPLYLMLQRNSYLPLYTDRVRDHFSSVLHEDGDEEIWFDVDGKPLKWHHPIGVLMDVFCSGGQRSIVNINVHFNDFPDKCLIHLKNLNAIESCFMSTLKEADHLKHRGHVINSMNRSQHKQLWNSLRTGDYDKFWSINAKLMEYFENTNAFKYIPLRLYENEEVHQKLVAPVDTDGQMVTLGDFLCNYSEQCSAFKAISHGIDLPLDVPLQWLSEHMSYADNFLHIALFKT